MLLTSLKSFSQNLDEVLNGEYEQHFISSGNNFSQISLQKNDRYLFLVALHNGFTVEAAQQKLGWNDGQLQDEIKLLIENGYLKGKKGSYFPAINIVMQNEGKKIFQHCDQAAERIANTIIESEPEIKKIYLKTEVSDNYDYEELSFFILSDVLLDNWQINHVEAEFLKQERPLRHGKRYYIQYAEKDIEATREVFGVYGNQYLCNETSCFITYGNNRKNNFKKIEDLLESKLPVLTVKDQQIFEEMAALYSPILIQILNENRNQFLDFYENSVHKNETGFEEFFIWYYHFLYTRSTDKLAEKGIISLPESGVFRVRLER